MNFTTTTTTFAATMLMSLSAAHADTQSQRYEFSSTESPYLAITPIVPFDIFGGLRTLTDVEVSIAGRFHADVTMENESSEPNPDAAVVFSADLSIIGPGHLIFTMDDVAVAPSVLGPSDRIPGAGTDFVDFGTLAVSGSDYRNPDPAHFIGSGPVDMYVFTERRVISSGVAPATIDITGYGVAGHLKVVYTFEGPAVHPDLDGSGTVDYGDLVRVLAAWGRDAASGVDINGDDIVDMNDLLEILSYWGHQD